ncbi:divalent metal cation transporter (plasmid) [Rhizobium sp. CB3090]|uniref:NRAMP family divalent metal transporter n=1 Tax=Rhizobium sp. CB3090 TaxID=3039156 RepID=UPI0024B169D0|nr:divalent metal cation transporter [Rhizobium sp. CB3090]WFU13262.1 divalent metal cation transporter [Rhizobium sp. CB3090]
MTQDLLTVKDNSFRSRLSDRLALLREHPLARVGPGLITGVADDDPGGIATYSQAGAQFGLNMLWTMPISFPMMAVVQSTCARIGRVTGQGLAANIKRTFPPVVLLGVVFSLLVANMLNIAADVAAMGEVAELVTGLDRHLMTTLFVFGTLAMQVFIPYHRYVGFLKWLTVSLLAYAAVLFTVRVDWSQVVLRTIWPTVTITSSYSAVVVGVFGTTISPYLFFWQASEEVEDMNSQNSGTALVNNPAGDVQELRRIRWDTWSGMLYSNATAFFIILATAATLNVAGITHIDTAAQAASALRPLAGSLAALVFALGILGVGLIGVPVLAGSAGYAFAEAMGWRFGLERAPRDAGGFYAVIAISVLLALGIQYSPITPMNALFWSAVVNGLLAVPLIIVILMLASNPKVMGRYTIGDASKCIGWATVAVMTIAAITMFLP